MINTSVFFVTASEYPKLQAACPGDFPFTYLEFVARVDEGTAALEKQGIKARRIEVPIDDFLAWCNTEQREPDNRARATYASMLGSAKAMN
jgi:hypothetical protein